MKKWLVIAVLVAIAAPVLGARQTVVRTDPFGTGWTKQNSMNTELYQKTDPTETGFTGMDGAVITSGVVPSAKSLSPDKTSGIPSINFLYEANGTDTNGFGFLGPLNSSKNILYRISDESPVVGQVLKIDSISTGQTVTVGSGTMVADIVNLILSDETGGSGVPDGTSTDDILSWDGDSWEPIALTAHPAFASLLTAFNNAGLNSFTFTPSVTYPIWAATSPVSVSFDVTDTSTTYTVADVNYQYDGAGGFVENMTNTAGDTWTADVVVATDGAHTIQLEAVDNKSTPNSGQSAVYTINFDGTDPVIGTVTPSALTHDGTGVNITATIASVTEANEDYRQWSLYDVTDAAVQVDWATFTGLSISGISIPADQHTYRVDVRVYDLAGNVGTASSSNIVYEAPLSGLNDTFTDTDSTLLSSHTSDSSHTWTHFGTSEMKITTNSARTVTSTSMGMYTSSYTPSDADYTVRGTIGVASSGSSSPMVMGRCSSANATGYGARFSTGAWTLYRFASGIQTSIGTYKGDVPTTPLQVDLIMAGTTISVEIGGVERISVTDSTIASGNPGVGAYYTTINTAYIDDVSVIE